MHSVQLAGSNPRAAAALVGLGFEGEGLHIAYLLLPVARFWRKEWDIGRDYLSLAQGEELCFIKEW